MKRLLPLAIVAAVALGAPGLAKAAPCGLPDAKPLWVDHGVPNLETVFARPGITLAVSSGDFPAKVRAKGARTIYWDMYLNRRVGTSSAPADPATVPVRANSLFDFAVQQSGCATPYIVLNELFGSHLETPWSPSTAQYRANVLAFVKVLAERGARPLLLLSRRPYTASDEAAAWWREVATYADLVPEVYFSARVIHKAGPVLGNRRMRLSMRRSIGALTAIGIPTSKIGIVLGFQTRQGGRDGLQPSEAWYRVVKWQVLAAKQVAAETGIATVVSWGWAAYNADAVDPDKPKGACVYLWTRSPRLCDAPRVAGTVWNSSLTEGQLRIPAAQVCTIGRRGIPATQLALLTRVTADRSVASTALLARLAESAHEPVTTRDVLAAERAVIRVRFGGSAGAYRSALARANASVAIARAVLADELRRARVEARLPGRRPSAREVDTFYLSYPELATRAVRANPAPGWLAGRKTGVALHSVAPEHVFTVPAGRKLPVFGPDRGYTVTALGDVRPLGLVPLTQARPAIAAALSAYARRASFERWALKHQDGLRNQALCRRDEVPETGTVRLTAYLPFLSLVG